MGVFLLKRNCFFVNVEPTCATTSCEWPLLVRDRDHFFGWQFYNLKSIVSLKSKWSTVSEHLAYGFICTFAKCPTLTYTTQSMEELLVFCLAIQIFNLELGCYKFSSSSSLRISSRKRAPVRRPATKLSLRILGGRLWREAPAVFIFCLCSKPLPLRTKNFGSQFRTIITFSVHYPLGLEMIRQTRAPQPCVLFLAFQIDPRSLCWNPLWPEIKRMYLFILGQFAQVK